MSCWGDGIQENSSSIGKQGHRGPKPNLIKTWRPQRAGSTAEDTGIGVSLSSIRSHYHPLELNSETKMVHYPRILPPMDPI